jgi:DNA mismatch repair protein MutS2
VREILAGFASVPASQELALSLLPSSDHTLISQFLQRSAEARRLLSLEPDFSIRGVLDVREAVHMAARGKVLEPHVLVDIQATLAAARYVHTGLRKLSNELPLLWSIAERIVELPSIEDEVSRSISATGEVLDSASQKLASLREQLKETQQQLLDRLQSIMRSPRGRKALQSSFITERDGRYVLPLKAEFRRELRGIVHDVSNTGATVFVEPWSTVELGNELRQLTIEEKREVERILTALSARIGANEAEISEDVDLLAELDLELAKARYAAEANATEPELRAIDGGGHEQTASKAGMLMLVEARHPLLGRKAVPLTVEMGSDYSILVITGPNTGGKTVALKTIGLLTLMAQAGMPIPASEKSCIPIFDGVYADIGDEQSIEQTLSTFSWHMGNIVRIIKSSTGKGLVLLDELGTSTDPNEGAALARAILLYFQSMGTMVVATTHYSELKVFAHTTPGLRNASLDFDPKTLAPTYHLTMGIPGGSNAFAIASQLGLSPEIIGSAKEMMAKGAQDIEMLLADIMSEKRRIEKVRDSLEKERKSAEDLRNHWESELQRLQDEERSFLRGERDRLAEETSELQREIRLAVAELKKARSQANLERAEKALAVVREQLGGLSSRIKTSQGARKGEASEVGMVGAGDKVWLTEVNMWGDVLSVREEDGEIEVQVGQTRLRMNLGNSNRPRGRRCLSH